MPAKKNKGLNPFKKSRKTKIFLLFFSLSFLFWLLIKFSKEYTDSIPMHVDYVNFPKGKMLNDNSERFLNLTVKTYGFNLLKHRIFKKKVTVDLKGLKSKDKKLYYQLSKGLMPQIKGQLSSDIELIMLQPDTLFFELGSSKTKKVKVVPDLSINYQSGYGLRGELKIVPAEVSISGPEHHIDSIQEVLTKTLIKEDVNKSFTHKLALVEVAKELNVTYSDTKITVTGEVEKFTETSLHLNFEVENLPKNYTITTIPEKVEVIFQVGLSDFNKINENDFKISCDYQKTAENGLNYLIPELIAKPSFASQIKIVPSKIEYLIKK